DYTKQHHDCADLVICNPPFFKVQQESNLNENEYLQIARHEIKIDLAQIIQCACRLLNYGGRLALIHRPDRLIDIITLMQANDMEPKRLQLVYPKVNKKAHMILIEGVYKGNPGLEIEMPLYAHNEDGSYSNQVLQYFLGDNDEA
ncbi:MAG: tRNA1(Val) (adenine(37)-N6)-methyltransferase, partial [Bacilli bacterium]